MANTDQSSACSSQLSFIFTQVKGKGFCFGGEIILAVVPLASSGINMDRKLEYCQKVLR